jgi:hypothetical protein
MRERLVFFGVDLSTSPDRMALRCGGCGQGMGIASADRLLTAAQMVMAVRPANWDDDEDPDQVAAWSALEEALRANGSLPS